MSESKTKLLFICTANINRSRTAEDLFKDSDEYEVQSAGFIWHSLGGQVVTQKLIDWADKIFVMDEERGCHLTILKRKFNTVGKRIYGLDIMDIYSRNNPTLIELLKSGLAGFHIFI